MDAVRDFNLQNIFALSQAIILSEITLFPFVFLTRRGFRTRAISKMELFAKVANVYNLASLVAKCSILYFAGFLDPPLGKSYNTSCFAKSVSEIK